MLCICMPFCASIVPRYKTHQFLGVEMLWNAQTCLASPDLVRQRKRVSMTSSGSNNASSSSSDSSELDNYMMQVSANVYHAGSMVLCKAQLASVRAETQMKPFSCCLSRPGQCSLLTVRSQRFYGYKGVGEGGAHLRGCGGPPTPAAVKASLYVHCKSG